MRELFLFIETNLQVFSVISMNIINPNISSNQIAILPRSYDSLFPLDVVLVDEGSNKKITPLVSNDSIIGNELTFNIDGVYVEGRMYTFTVDQDGKNIFRGKIYATEFNQDNYTINNNEFVIDIDSDSDSIPVYE